MRLVQLREQVLRANLELVKRGLVLYTFGNASAISRSERLVVIKPSGVPYERMDVDDLVITDLDGIVIEGSLKPSSDLPTHLVLYREFKEIGAVVHTHSEYATAWAQARKPIPALGTTHADYFHGSVPVTEEMTAGEISDGYERNTGEVIARRFKGIDPLTSPAVLVANHGPFVWGRDSEEAVHNAVVLEAIARMAYLTVSINGQAEGIDRALHDKHFNRKHGRSAYYGQAGDKQ